MLKGRLARERPKFADLEAKNGGKQPFREKKKQNCKIVVDRLKHRPYMPPHRTGTTLQRLATDPVANIDGQQVPR